MMMIDPWCVCGDTQSDHIKPPGWKKPDDEMMKKDGEEAWWAAHQSMNDGPCKVCNCPKFKRVEWEDIDRFNPTIASVPGGDL